MQTAGMARAAVGPLEISPASCDARRDDPHAPPPGYFFLPPPPALSTFVAIVAVLFAGLGSALSRLTVAVFVIVVGPLTITVTLICADSMPPLATSPRYHVTVPVCPAAGAVKCPRSAAAETNVEPLDNVSFTIALTAVSGPKLRTV